MQNQKNSLHSIDYSREDIMSLMRQYSLLLYSVSREYEKYISVLEHENYILKQGGFSKIKWKIKGKYKQFSYGVIRSIKFFFEKTGVLKKLQQTNAYQKMKYIYHTKGGETK